ncbi:MAG TPA: anion transporter, partial [Microscillaceae bacterium]|nr:anion transporter [Microscillaceae bacterium]
MAKTYALSQKWGLFAGPLLCVAVAYLPALSFFQPKAQWAISIGLWMLVWWISEAIPMAATALLPLVLFPLVGLLDLKEAAAPYANPVIFLFMGGFMIALAMEKWRLHLRIALNIIRLTGTQAHTILLGMMCATALLSMWISNTATTLMMLPIASSIISLLTSESANLTSKQQANFALVLMLGIAYAASIGGIATLVGTPPNTVFAGFMAETYQYQVGFGAWMMVGVPFALLLLVATYGLLLVLYPSRIRHFEGAEALIQKQLADLGKMSRGETLTLAVFIATAFLWMGREYLIYWLPAMKNLTDTGIAMMAGVVLFVLPTDW